MKKFLLSICAQILILTSIAYAAPNIIEKPVIWNAYRERLTREYSLEHYGFEATRIDPKAVVVHWTAGNMWQGAYDIFYYETMEDGTVNVSAQFIVDKDGTIYRTMPENYLARHAIGYNWCAIGIENVGGVGNVEDLTEAQLQSNIELIRYLREKYPNIEYVFGHYQQLEAIESGLRIENDPNYFAGKPDPGPIFMRALREALEGEGFKFFKE